MAAGKFVNECFAGDDIGRKNDRLQIRLAGGIEYGIGIDADFYAQPFFPFLPDRENAHADIGSRSGKRERIQLLADFLIVQDELDHWVNVGQMRQPVVPVEAAIWTGQKKSLRTGAKGFSTIFKEIRLSYRISY